DQIVAALARLPGDARRDDEHVGALAVSPARRARDARVVPQDGPVLLQVERLPLREIGLLRDIEEDDVPEFFPGHEGGELAADVSGSDEGDLLAGSHAGPSSTARARAEVLSPGDQLAVESPPMVGKDTLARALSWTLEHTHFPTLGMKYEGKVRDNYTTT